MGYNVGRYSRGRIAGDLAIPSFPGKTFKKPTALPSIFGRGAAMGSIIFLGPGQVGIPVGLKEEAGGGQLRALASPDFCSFGNYCTVNLILGQKVTLKSEKYFSGWFWCENSIGNYGTPKGELQRIRLMMR